LGERSADNCKKKKKIYFQKSNEKKKILFTCG
jgi:hypothetical protein